MYQPEYGTLAEVFLTEEKRKKGGRREGAGRPVTSRRARSVMFNDEEWKWIKERGGSEFLRRLVERERDHAPRTVKPAAASEEQK